jgi:hypothetical protein
MHTELSDQCLQNFRLDPFDHLQMMPERGIVLSVPDSERQVTADRDYTTIAIEIILEPKCIDRISLE